MQSRSSSQAAVRVVFENKTRRIRLSEVTFANLASSVADRFKTSAAISFGYVDEEEEFIQVTSDKELQFALNHFQQKLKLIAKPAQPSLAVTPVAIQPQVVAPAVPQVPQPVAPVLVNTIPQAPTPVAVQPSVPTTKQEPTPTPQVFSSEEKPSRKRVPKTRPSKDAPSLKPKSVRITSQFFLLKGSDEQNNRKRLVVPAGTKFSKVLKIRNDFKDTWPADTRLSFVQGDQEALGVPTVITVTPVQPSEETEIKISGKAPKQPGKFSCVFQFCSNDKFVGKKIKIMVVVKEPKDDVPTQQEAVVEKKTQRKNFREDKEDQQEIVKKERAPQMRRKKT